MRFVREKIAVALTSGALVAGSMAGCIGGDDNAAPGVDAGGSPSSDSGSSPPNDATAPSFDASTSDVASPPAEASAPNDTDAPVDTGVDAGPEAALVRFAWFVGGVPTVIQGGASPQATGIPAYDVCLAPHGTGAWVGPLLAASSFAAGMQPFDVTQYFSVLPGQYDARIVAAGSASCDLPDAGTGLGATPPDGGGGDDGSAIDASPDDASASAPPSTDFTSLPPVLAGAAMTAVLVDPLDPSKSIADLFTFHDDTKTASGKAKIRFVNVSESDVVTQNVDDAGNDAGVTVAGSDYWIGGGVAHTNLFTNVTSAQGIDPSATNGYRDVDPLSSIDSTLYPGVNSHEDVSALGTTALALPAGAIMTAFYASEPSSGFRLPVLVWCYDGQPSAASSHLTKCDHVDVASDSLQSFTRFGDFSMDGESVDVCVKYHSYGTYAGPLLAYYAATSGADAGAAIPSQFLSAYFSLHGGFEFDTRFVAAGSTDCATPLPATADTTYSAAVEPGGGGYTSVLLTGYQTVPADAGAVPPYDAGPPFEDDAGGDAGPQPTSVGLTSLAKTVVVIEDEAYAANRAPALRLVHLDAAHPQPITALLTGGPVIIGGSSGQERSPLLTGPNQWELDNVPYGGFSTRPGPMDPFGYETTTSAEITIDLDANEWSYGMANGDQTTLFAFDSAGNVQLLACDDYNEDWYYRQPLYTDCCVVGAPGCGGTVKGTWPASSSRSRPLRHFVRTRR